MKREYSPSEMDDFAKQMAEIGELIAKCRVEKADINGHLRKVKQEEEDHIQDYLKIAEKYERGYEEISNQEPIPFSPQSVKSEEVGEEDYNLLLLAEANEIEEEVEA